MIDTIGFALLGGSALAAALCLLAWRTRGRGRGIVLGLSLLLFFVLTRLMLERLLPSMVDAQPRLRLAVDQGLAALAALSAAFAVDAAIRRYVWYGTFREGDHSKVPRILIGLASLAGYGLTCLLIASQLLGLDVTAVAATSGVVAIVLGLSAQQTLGQIFAGLALNMSKPFRAGDSIQLDGLWGVVVDVHWRAVTLRTYEGNLVTLPNQLVAAAKVTNLDQPTRELRHHIAFVVGIGTPPGRVREAALEAMLGQPFVLRQPEPLVLLKEFTDRGILFEAIFWHVDPNLYILRRDEVGQALWYSFRRAGIAFAVHRRLLADPEGSQEPEDQAVPEALLEGMLRRSPVLAGFPDDQLRALAVRSRRLLYAAGDRIMRQGEQGASMFVVLEGSVSVRLENDSGVEAEIYTQGKGDTFGHMSALTGAARFATVRAVGHLVLAEIDRSALAPLIAAHPELVELVAREMVRIEAAQTELQRTAGSASGRTGVDPRGLLDRLTDRIGAFFNEQSTR